jgi:tetratricopeptide (TPR) repeat protein
MEQLGVETRSGTDALRGQVLVNLCALALEEDDWEEVAAWESAFEEVHEALERQGLRAQGASVLFDAGNRAVKDERVTQARRLYLRAVALDPGFGEVWYNLAVLASEDGELREAQEHLRRAIESEETFADAHFLLGTLLLPTSPEDALKHMEAAISLSPENAHWTTLVGSAHARQRNFERAREFFARSLQMDDSQADAHLGFAVASRALGDQDTARAALRKAFKLNPQLATQIQQMMQE